MKDQVKEFEDLNNRIEKLFEGLGWLNPGNWFRDKPKSDEPNRTYQRGPELTKYLSKIESDDCDYGTSNGRFSSEPGGESAYFYDKKGNVSGEVKNIQPFLKNAKITKQTLRCYNLDKDPLKIGWLFDGKFENAILSWDTKNKKVIFQGKWKGGLFGGIAYQNPEETPEVENKVYGFYVLSSRNKLSGPYTANQIVVAVGNGSLSIDSIIRPENSPDYQSIRDNKLLSTLIKSTTTSVHTKTKKPFKKPSVVKATKKKP